jgi:PAS domain-containing protein
MGLTDLPFFAEVALATSTLLGMWWAGVRWVWPKLRATGRAVSGLMSVGTRADALLSGLDAANTNQTLLLSIKDQVLPNGGGSLRDSVTRTEATVNLLVGQVRARADAEDDVAELVCDASGSVEWLSRALMTWTQRTSDELKQFGWISSIHPDEREDVAAEWDRCIKHGRQFDSAFRLIDRDGDAVMVRMSGMGITTRRTSQESVTRWVATLRRIDGANPNLKAPERNGHLQSRQPI